VPKSCLESASGSKRVKMFLHQVCEGRGLRTELGGEGLFEAEKNQSQN